MTDTVPVQHQDQHQESSSSEQKTDSFQTLFNNLSHVIAVSRRIFDSQRTSNKNKQYWGRLLIAGCEAYAKLLEASKIDEIENRLTKLEEKNP